MDQGRSPSGLALEPIERLEQLDVDTFIERYYEQRPLVFGNYAAQWRCCNHWDVDYFRRRVGSRTVQLWGNERGIYNFRDSPECGAVQKLAVPFSLALDRISNPDAGRRYYIKQPVIMEFPELLEDLHLPHFIPQRQDLRTLNLWLGADHTVSSLHYDLPQNFLVVVRGSKQFLMASPADTPLLYQNSGEKFPQMSRCNLENYDEHLFPDVKRVRFGAAELSAGDMIYIPSRWWHHVTSWGFNIALSFSWERRAGAMNRPAMQS
jgi:lysine-specific demethylase 8